MTFKEVLNKARGRKRSLPEILAVFDETANQLNVLINENAEVIEENDNKITEILNQNAVISKESRRARTVLNKINDLTSTGLGNNPEFKD
jgi:hypothetical protein